jgi:hypothetical protein
MVALVSVKVVSEGDSSPRKGDVEPTHLSGVPYGQLHIRVLDGAPFLRLRATGSGLNTVRLKAFHP